MKKFIHVLKKVVMAILMNVRWSRGGYRAYLEGDKLTRRLYLCANGIGFLAFMGVFAFIAQSLLGDAPSPNWLLIKILWIYMIGIYGIGWPVACVLGLVIHIRNRYWFWLVCNILVLLLLLYLDYKYLSYFIKIVANLGRS